MSSAETYLAQAYILLLDAKELLTNQPMPVCDCDTNEGFGFEHTLECVTNNPVSAQHDYAAIIEHWLDNVLLTKTVESAMSKIEVSND